MRGSWSWVVAGAVIGALALGGCATTSSKGMDRVTRGQYLVTIMDCAGCHTPGALLGQPDGSRRLGGSTIGFGIPRVGVFYPPNLTPDRDTGLGRWSDAEIIRALKNGMSRDGRPLAPIMPWPSYSTLTEDDVQAIVAFLRTLPPVSHAIPRPVPPGTKAPSPYLTVVEPN